MTTHGERSSAEQDYRSYYGQPVLKEPAWTWEVPWYLWYGGLTGVSSSVAALARRAGDHRLADRAALVAASGAAVNPALLVADLGRPHRFLNMLRVVKPTSAMSMGSWTLFLHSSAAATTGALTLAGRLPRLRGISETASGLLGLLMASYTGVLVADTSIPVWHEARRELPALFAGSAAASAGAALLLVDGGSTAPRRLALGGAVAEIAAARAMRLRLGEIGEVYDQPPARGLQHAAEVCAAAGAGIIVAGSRARRRSRGRALVAAGSAVLLAGAACQRWAVFKAGFASARDPKYVVKPQRDRVRGQSAEG